LTAAVPTVAAILLFALTANFRVAMVLKDKWTMFMLLFTVVNVVLAVFVVKKTQTKEERVK
jgi:hypothetical protein